jgi:hypothetical protein
MRLCRISFLVVLAALTSVGVAWGYHIYFDDAHDNNGDSIYSNYTQLAAAVAGAGHTYEEKTVTITAAELAGFDVLVVLDPELAFSAAELSAIHTWVDGPHGLWVLGEHSGASSHPAMNDLLLPYGISFVGNASGTMLNQFSAHPITQGVSTMTTPAPGLLSGGTIVGQTELGEAGVSVYETAAGGRVTVVNDSDFAKDGYIGTYDEVTFCLNVVSWLGEAVPVELASFTAGPAQGGILVRWATLSETDNVGFNLYRSLRSDGAWVAINTALIPGAGTTSERHDYSFLDDGVTQGVTYYYQLEDVDVSGRTTTHGPISASTSGTPITSWGIVKAAYR